MSPRPAIALPIMVISILFGVLCGVLAVLMGLEVGATEDAPDCPPGQVDSTDCIIRVDADIRRTIDQADSLGVEYSINLVDAASGLRDRLCPCPPHIVIPRQEGREEIDETERGTLSVFDDRVIGVTTPSGIALKTADEPGYPAFIFSGVAVLLISVGAVGLVGIPEAVSTTGWWSPAPAEDRPTGLRRVLIVSTFVALVLVAYGVLRMSFGTVGFIIWMVCVLLVPGVIFIYAKFRED